MFRGNAETDTSRKDQQQQEEKRRQERRQQEQQPNEPRRQEPGHPNMAMNQGRNEMNPDSPPGGETGSRGQTSGNRQDENFQRGTGQAQKSDSQTPRQQSAHTERHDQKGDQSGRQGDPSSGKDFRSGEKEGNFDPPGKKSHGA